MCEYECVSGVGVPVWRCECCGSEREGGGIESGERRRESGAVDERRM